MNRLIITFIAAVIAAPICAQQLAFKNYTRANGLASDYVLCIFQDRDGFIWFGTDRGVSRYDGQSFKTYTTNEGFKSNFIYAICQDNSGALWFGTYDGGVTKFDGTTFRTFTTNDGLPSNQVGAITKDAFGRMYFRTTQGIVFLAKDSTFQLLDSSARSILGPLPDGSFMVADSVRVRRFIPLAKDVFTFTELSVSGDEKLLTSGVLPQSSVVVRGEEVCFATKDGVARLVLDSRGTASARLMSPRMFVNAIAADRKDAVWFATEGDGIGKEVGGKIEWYNERHGVARVRVKFVYRDYEGSLWFGTLGGGVQRLLNEEVKSYRVSDGLPVNDVTTVFQDSRRRVWVGTSSGIAVIDDDALRVGFPFATELSDVRALAQAPNGSMYLATFDGLFGPFIPSAGMNIASIPHRNIPYGASAIAIQPKTPSLQSEYLLWVGSYGGGTHRIEGRNVAMLSGNNGAASDMIEDVVKTGESIWLLTRDKGATRIRNAKLETYSRADGLPSNSVNAVYEDEVAQTIWVGTTNGIARFNGKSVTLFDKTNGLSDDNVLGIFRTSASDSNIVVVTENGIHKFFSERFHRFGPLVMLPFPDMKINRLFFSSATSTLWLATTGGVVKVDTRNGHLALPPPKVMLTQFVVDTIRLNYPSRSSPSVLAHDQNNPGFRFSALSFADEQGMRYRYRLAPVDKDWSQLTNDPHLQYRNLADGRYTFCVIAVNAEGTPSSQPAEYSFRILPPFWRTWWFGSSTFAFAIVAFGGIVRFISVRKLKKKVQELERENAIQQERERISRDLHDHVGAQLVNIISGLDLVGKYSPPSETRTQRLLKSLQHDARSSILQLRETIWAIKTQAMTPEKFAAQVETYSRQQMEYYDPELVFLAEVSGDCELTPIQVLNCFRIIQEAISNSMKHARAKHAWITLRTFGEARLFISIKDDGIGMGKSSVSQFGGNGITNMRKRAEEIGAVLRIGSANGSGIEVTIDVPLTNKRAMP